MCGWIVLETVGIVSPPGLAIASSLPFETSAAAVSLHKILISTLDPAGIMFL
jgi:hypothetical protein